MSISAAGEYQDTAIFSACFPDTAVVLVGTHKPESSFWALCTVDAGENLGYYWYVCFLMWESVLHKWKSFPTPGTRFSYLRSPPSLYRTTDPDFFPSPLPGQTGLFAVFLFLPCKTPLQCIPTVRGDRCGQRQIQNIMKDTE